MYNFGPINQITNNKLNKNKVDKDNYNKKINELEKDLKETNKEVDNKVDQSDYKEKITEIELINIQQNDNIKNLASQQWPEDYAKEQFDSLIEKYISDNKLNLATKDDLNYIKVPLNFNRIGYYNNQGFQDYSSNPNFPIYATPLYRVNSKDILIIKQKHIQQYIHVITFFDEFKNQISGIYCLSPTQFDEPITVPEDCHYIACSIDKNFKSEVYIVNFNHFENVESRFENVESRFENVESITSLLAKLDYNVFESQDLLPIAVEQFYYTSSTFIGWGAPIGNPSNFNSIIFKIRNRSTNINYIENIIGYISIKDKTGEVLTSANINNAHIAPGETKEVVLLFDNIKNEEKIQLYAGFSCDQYIDVIAGPAKYDYNAYGNITYNYSNNNISKDYLRPLNIYSNANNSSIKPLLYAATVNLEAVLLDSVMQESIEKVDVSLSSQIEEIKKEQLILNKKVEEIDDNTSFMLNDLINISKEKFQTCDISNIDNIPGISYNTSIFSGWGAFIGNPKQISEITFPIKTREDFVNKITINIRRIPESVTPEGNYFIPSPGEWEVLYTEDFNLIEPIEVSEKWTNLKLKLTNLFINENNENLFFDFNTNGLISFRLILDNSNHSEYPYNTWAIYYIKNGKFSQILYSDKPISERIEYYKMPVEIDTGFSHKNIDTSKDGKFGKYVNEVVENTITEIITAQSQDAEVVLAPKYYAVVGDTLQLYYRGIVKAWDPYNYGINVICNRGKNYPRYFEFTPTADDIGTYNLTVQARKLDGTIISSANTKIEVVDKNISSDFQKEYNMLCFGDSLTSGGYWCGEGLRRIFGDNNSILPAPTKPTNIMVNTYGKKSATINEYKVKHEGYGGWTWNSFLSSSQESSTTNGIIVTLSSPHGYEINTVQKSLWVDNNNKNWELEDLPSTTTIKFNRGVGNNGAQSSTLLPTSLICDSLNLTITPQSVVWESGNPFYNEETDSIDFINHAKECGVVTEIGPDIVAVLLTWNGGGGMNSANTENGKFDFANKNNVQINNAKKLLRILHTQCPQAHVFVMGIQINSITGGCGANYGATGSYSDAWSTLVYAFEYNKALMSLCQEPEFSTYCEYLDTKAEFDTEYNMPYIEKNVNTRTTIKEKLGTNGVHPSIDGYYQIGDTLYRALMAFLYKNNT